MKNNKGFTLIELLTALVILGIITGMSFPVITALRNRNEKKKYETYEETMISAAKLYVDAYKDDFINELNSKGYYEIKYEMLKRKNLIKDIKVEDVTCDSYHTSVFVIVDPSNKKKYKYKCNLSCSLKSDPNTNTYQKIDTNGKDYNKSNDNIAPKIDNVNIESENALVQSKKIKIDITASDVYNEDNQANSQLSFCVAQDSNSCKNGGVYYKMNYDSEIEGQQDGTNVKSRIYKLNNFIYNTKHAYDGSSFNIYITVKDAADNYAEIEPIKYKIYECKYKKKGVNYGDIDGDGYINTIDAALLKRYLAYMMELNAQQLEAADVDLDGDVSIVDATVIDNYLNHSYSTLPWPYNSGRSAQALAIGKEQQKICESN